MKQDRYCTDEEMKMIARYNKNRSTEFLDHCAVVALKELMRNGDNYANEEYAVGAFNIAVEMEKERQKRNKETESL
jgi:hypothetical protein